MSESLKPNDVVYYSDNNGFIEAVLLEKPNEDNIALCKINKASNKTIKNEEIYLLLDKFSFLKRKETFYGALKKLI